MHVSVSPAIRQFGRAERRVPAIVKLAGLMVLAVVLAGALRLSPPSDRGKFDANSIVSPFDVTNAPPPGVSRNEVRVVTPRRMLAPSERARLARYSP